MMPWRRMLSIILPVLLFTPVALSHGGVTAASKKANPHSLSQFSEFDSFPSSKFPHRSFASDPRLASWLAKSGNTFGTKPPSSHASHHGSISGLGSSAWLPRGTRSGSGLTQSHSALPHAHPAPAHPSPARGAEPPPDPNSPMRHAYIRNRPVGKRTANMPPFPLAKWPHPVKSQADVQHLVKQLDKHDGPAHTLFRQGSRGPVVRLQKDGHGFDAWEHTGGAPGPAEKEKLQKHRASNYVEA